MRQDNRSEQTRSDFIQRISQFFLKRPNFKREIQLKVTVAQNEIRQVSGTGKKFMIRFQYLISYY